MNGIKALKISIVVIIIVALIYLVVGMFLGGGGDRKDKFQNFSHRVAGTPKTSTEGTDKTMAALDGIVITLGGGKYHYLKADFSLKMKNREDKKSLEKNIDDVRDLILRYTSVQNSDKLDTQKGKEEYKQNLIKAIYHTFGYEVEDIYFRNFVLAP